MDSIKVGDTVECAVWLNGTETPEQIARWKDHDCPVALRMAGNGAEIVVGPAIFEAKYPGEDRVPPVPDHISGPDVRLLVAEARVVGIKTVLPPRSFLLDLEPRDLDRLRKITRRAWMKSGGARLSDAECDEIIEQIGPDAAANAVREAVDGCTVH